MKVTIEKMPELRVGAVRHVGPYNTPETTKPQDLRTDLYIPLEEK